MTTSSPAADSLAAQAMVFAGAPPTVSGGDDPRPWVVAVVDDDDDVHQATALALRGLRVDGRPFELLHAHSAAQAFELIAGRPDIAVALVDVVMETDAAGLDLVRRVREQLGRQALRIVLRTGQPGQAPEMQTVQAFDINDYRTKAELTRVRLFATLCTAIRSFRQFDELERQRDALQAMNAELARARDAEQAEAGRRAAAEQALAQARQATEQQVAERTRSLSAAVDELDAFSRRVAHDLRGPLDGLAGLSGLMLEKVQQAQAAGNAAWAGQLPDWLQLMRSQTHQLAGLVGDLLQLSRADQGPLQGGPVALDAQLDQVLDVLALQWPAERLRAIQRPARPLPVVSGDAALLRQVLANLLGNALKFSAVRDQPLVRLSAHPAARPGWCTLRIEDNGSGFDPARASQLFQPFQRLHGAEVPGTGLGLSIVRRIVERHGGQVRAEGRPGLGATFEIDLPAADAPTTPP
ncbi:MAG: hybrid sensor histidine kinase/response regulator [Burkholderiaceae bacterium]|nr:hybrid sensor histidine kinase/response regulator [Burkholderiaceae bacterium]